MNINVNIDRIVLDGVDSPSGSPQFERALKSELRNSLAVGADALRGLESRDQDTIASGPTELGDHQNFAQQVARQIAEGIQP